MKSIFEVRRYEDSLIPTDSRLFKNREDAEKFAKQLVDEAIKKPNRKVGKRYFDDGPYTVFNTDENGWSTDVYCQVFVSNRRLY